MLLIITKADGTEEAYEVAPSTRLAARFEHPYWYFRITTGGEIAMHEAVVSEVKLGNVHLAEIGD